MIQKPLIITAGEKYNDIDALGCGVAYQKLLEPQGKSAAVVFRGPLNESVTKTIRSWDYDLQVALLNNAAEFNYILVDVSEPSHFAKFVILDQVVEIFDHRYGFQDYWLERLGDKSRIDLVGACATLIWEEYKKAGLAKNIDTVSANLLSTAIVSNTLNMQAH